MRFNCPVPNVGGSDDDNDDEKDDDEKDDDDPASQSRVSAAFETMRGDAGKNSTVSCSDSHSVPVSGKSCLRIQEDDRCALRDAVVVVDDDDVAETPQ